MTKTIAKSKAPEAQSTRITIEDNASGPLRVEMKCKEAKEIREESKRGQLLMLLQHANGCTMDQACKKFGWKPRDFADALRLLGKVNGIITERNADGRWKRVTK